MTSLPRDVQRIATEIEEYLVSNPEASDSLDGIQHWWTGRGRYRERAETVQRALDVLLLAGKLSKRTMPDGETVYAGARPPGEDPSDDAPPGRAEGHTAFHRRPSRGGKPSTLTSSTSFERPTAGSGPRNVASRARRCPQRGSRNGWIPWAGTRSTSPARRPIDRRRRPRLPMARESGGPMRSDDRGNKAALAGRPTPVIGPAPTGREARPRHRPRSSPARSPRRSGRGGRRSGARCRAARPRPAPGCPGPTSS